MKFKCFHRVASGAIECVNLDVSNRHAAFKTAQSNNWLVTEMRPVAFDVKPRKVKKTIVNHPKCPNAEELALLRIRRDAFWIGFWCSWLPLFGWIIALFATFFKYDMRGLKCCVHGMIALDVPVLFTLLALSFISLGIAAHSVLWSPILLLAAPALIWFGWWCPFHLYKKQVLMGYVVDNWEEL